VADHLQLPAPIRLDSRRARGGRGDQTAPPSPGRHGKKLTDELGSAVESQRETRSVEGVDPSFVFKIKASTRINDSTFRTSGLQFLGDTSEWTYFVFVAGDSPEKLIENLEGYTAAGDDRSEADNRTFFESIEGILPYGHDDRRGHGLPPAGHPLEGTLVVDVVLWPSPDLQEARKRVGDVHTILELHKAPRLAEDIRARFTLVRARVDQGCLDDLLDLSAVELIRRPPTPRLEPSTWRGASVGELPDPDIQPSAPVGLIDDAVADHPLLPDEVLASRSAVPEDRVWGSPSDHGTLVAGLIAYGDIEASLSGESDWTAISPIHSSRVLEPDPDSPGRTRFPTEQPAHAVIEAAIRGLHDDHGVRVFNLSIAEDFPFSGSHVSPWTESLDELARELDVVIVVAAGNYWPSDLGPETDAHRAYPSYMFTDQARVAEPSIAANVLTVGSLAHADVPQRIGGESRPGDRAIAPVGAPSPFTRTGPGVSGAIKPDLAADGGNWVLNDVDMLQTRDHGVSVISLVQRDGELFGLANGTSFAAPRIARLASQALYRYPGASANLIRALVASGSRPITRASGMRNDDLLRAGGHGRPVSYRILESESRRVAMTYEGTISADTAAIHPVPIPLEFTKGRTERTVTVALAFDPEVRRTRREYLSSHMVFDLVRAVSEDEAREIWKRQPTDRSERLDMPKDRRRIDLQPGVQTGQGSTLQVRSFRTRELNEDDGDTYYLIVTHIGMPWKKQDERYALVVTLEDEEREDIDLYASLAIRLSPRIRLRP